MTTAREGDTVTIDFTVKKDDGTIVGNTQQDGPQTITLGGGEIFPPIEAALTGMEEGEQKTVELACENGFGPRRPELIIDIPRANLPAEMAPQPGMGLQAQAPTGQPINLVIIEVGDDSVKADGNHPLAGETLTFDITLREVKAAA
ncbi:FKBP-type peptidyl-prolyl cis-trans isomerase [Sphingomicrobium astaxanthinifaciens]|uniref:FKBP-type peptidyl-prolyl cis-trans isomerase n=1 Tax=Sphingomicrobium astaxanthinifaciens TaxID=1227949 RepID=UPI001FCA7653|nr:peptidylprolyl isomerase [Sphingomicrobium astaxanthinifaciens]MCJ7422204.1 peptidylprolyl isomerase [Sphingomicrobium astaxanthinifaciens]